MRDLAAYFNRFGHRYIAQGDDAAKNFTIGHIMSTNLIVNGTFDADPGDADYGWSGTDLETDNDEDTYQSNGNTENSVAEMNGSKNATTVMEQTFTVDNALTTELTLDAAMRNSTNFEVGVDGFLVEITDSEGTVIFSTTVYPDSITFETYTFDVTFPSAGDYTITFTELGDDTDGYGALVDNIVLMVCLTTGSMISTPHGNIAVEDLVVGMPVDTADGPKPLRWIGRKTLRPQDLDANEKLRPVLIRSDALGAGIPARDMRVSRQHRMVVSSAIAERMFGARDVLVSAIRLTALSGIDVCTQSAPVTYYHLLFDDHAVITADNAQTESLFVGPVALSALSDDAREEVLALFPQLEQATAPQPAAPIPTRHQQISLINRHVKNARAVQGG